MSVTGLALNSGWTSTTIGDNSGGYGGGGIVSDTITYGTSYPWYPSWSYPVYCTTPARPIKLTLSEIDKLRKMAKGDKAIQAILEKFTDQIEIAVDFG